MTLHYSNTSLTSSVQLNQVLVVLTVILASDFSSNQNKKNSDGFPSHLSQKPLNAVVVIT